MVTLICGGFVLSAAPSKLGILVCFEQNNADFVSVLSDPLDYSRVRFQWNLGLMRGCLQLEIAQMERLQIEIRK